ncbi:hypothetical protein [Actinoallomurus iriomotensis]|uniref:Uncharacterized protein n=1 Tax=Actinoallomurus iriomotensis TaxID=478107 RepID=A0A9W6RUB6_9ACTN|nr:hypothetical protein [Actinoallomurus iriomotensis]GLY82006.1 hypothetical protein Airi01_102730 [Actinoallomurus iriomotensis]
MSIVYLTGVEIEFARGLAGRVRWAREHNNGFPSPAWPTKERLAVALAMGNQDYLTQQGYRISSALDRVCVGMICRYDDRIAWLNNIRDLVDRFIREAG